MQRNCAAIRACSSDLSTHLTQLCESLLLLAEFPFEFSLDPNRTHVGPQEQKTVDEPAPEPPSWSGQPQMEHEPMQESAEETPFELGDWQGVSALACSAGQSPDSLEGTKQIGDVQCITGIIKAQVEEFLRACNDIGDAWHAKNEESPKDRLSSTRSNTLAHEKLSPAESSDFLCTPVSLCKSLPPESDL